MIKIMQVYKFNTMFRGQAVVIEYGYADTAETDIDYAYITDDNKRFIHPDYEWGSNWLDKFHEEVYILTAIHILKVKEALKQLK